MISKRNFLVFSFVFCLIISECQSQSDLEIASYNILLGAVTGGLGATINKPAEVQWNKAFYNGAWKGALGGSTMYLGKKITAEIKSDDDWWLAWSGRIVHNSGASMLENVANYNPMFSQINFNLGFIRNEFHFQEGFLFKPRIKPLSLGLTLYSAVGNTFEVSKSLTYAVPIFTSKPSNLPNAAGIAHANAIVLRDRFIDVQDLIIHEIIHTYQYDEYAVFNSFLPLLNSETFKLRDGLFYYEYHAVPFYSFYFVDELIQGRGFNFLEREAYLFGWERERRRI